jgi:hypothetical protein
LCNGQDFAFFDHQLIDTSFHSLKVKINDQKIVSASKTNDYKIKQQAHSLAFRNDAPSIGSYSLHRKIYEPISLNYKVNFDIDEPFQMTDGTYWFEETNIRTTRLYPLLGTMLALNLVAYNYVRGVWEQEKTTRLHSINWWVDVHNYQRMDKLGHFSVAYKLSDLTSKLYRWSGVSGESSIWLGALSGWMWMFEIEVSDGLFEEWGFSWLDLTANTLGSGFFILQQYFPEALGGLQPKISYHVSSEWKNKIYTKDLNSFIDDYEGMTFWLGINPYHYFPDSWKKDYPGWLAPLGVAIGYGAEGIAKAPQGGKPEWFIGLDIDLRQLPIADESGFMKFLKSELNFIRLPLPAIRFTPSGIWYGLYF